MIGGAQPKVLLTQSEDSTLYLDPMFESIFDKPEEFRYKLIRERDQLVKQSQDIKWLEYDENENYKADFPDIAIGRSLLMSPFNQSFTWNTTLVTEILLQKEGYTKFKTENSVYELFKI